MPKAIARDPVYKQVTQTLLELIRSEFSIGDQFLTERQVSERFGISRTTANKALSNLVIDGVLEFRKGVGTFVSRPKPSVNLRQLVSFTEKARAAGLRPKTTVRSFRSVPVKRLRFLPSTEVATILEIDEASHIYEMERLRSLDEQKVIYERRALRSDLCPGLQKGETAGSLYTLLHDRYSLELEGVAQRIRARNLNTVEAGLFGVPEGSAALELTGVGYLSDGTPLWYEETVYRGDTYEFVNQLRLTGDEYQSSLDPQRPAGKANNTTLWYRWE